MEEDPRNYHDITRMELWSSFDLTQLLSNDAAFGAGCFDGRYVYWDAYDGSTPGMFLVRYDTRGTFSDPTSWSKWWLSTIGSSASKVFDGRFVYLGIYLGRREARYDTQAPFGDASVSSSPLISAGPEAGSFPWPGLYNRATFDGRYVYFPNNDPVAARGSMTVRYDTRGTFEDKPAWTEFDPQLDGIPPAIFAAPYVFLTPARGGENAAVVYDTRLPFDSATSWSSFPLKNVTGGDEVFAGAGTDGRYIYYVPRGHPLDGGGNWGDGLAARHDTSLPLADISSWETFQLTQVHPLAMGFDHASWDGRFFYFMVGSNELVSGDGGPGTDGTIVARYDTRQSFRTTSSWSTFDLSSLVRRWPPIWGGGVVFDGQYVYIAAARAPVIVRFDARSPPKMPSGFSGSFY